MHLILHHGWHDERFIVERCEGSTECRQPRGVSAQAWPIPRRIPEAEQLPRRPRFSARATRPMVVWAMGITQHTTGVINVLALGNLQMLLGNMGVPGGGVNPLRGQNNVQGACDMGACRTCFPVTSR
jgi:predicted molibdopterin-dependent oxidoreductase YjgC